jgi:hypothetical protein
MGQQLRELRSLCYIIRHSFELVNGRMIVTKAKALGSMDVSSRYDGIYDAQQDTIGNLI